MVALNLQRSSVVMMMVGSITLYICCNADAYLRIHAGVMRITIKPLLVAGVLDSCGTSRHMRLSLKEHLRSLCTVSPCTKSES